MNISNAQFDKSSATLHEFDTISVFYELLKNEQTQCLLLKHNVFFSNFKCKSSQYQYACFLNQLSQLIYIKSGVWREANVLNDKRAGGWWPAF